MEGSRPAAWNMDRDSKKWGMEDSASRGRVHFQEKEKGLFGRARTQGFRGPIASLTGG